MSEPRRIRVLIVDDEPQFRLNLTTVLNQRGFEIRTAGNGTEALQEIRKSPFDVVVLDINMPGMDGNETLREMKKMRPELEIIMLTGYGTLASALGSLREGVFDYLTKPCDIEALARRIRDAYEKKTPAWNRPETYS
jgi:DNA-binding NtrC family response regulator